MRTADGLALLREIARKHGPVEIFCDETNEPYEWRVSTPRMHEYGRTLEEAAEALYERQMKE